MHEVFSKIIEKLKELNTIDCQMKTVTCRKWDYGTIVKAIEIVKQEAEKYNNGHCGCNTNGEHEKCNGCGLTDCKYRNMIRFGVSDDNNGWVPCSERLPEEGGYYLVTYHGWSNGDYLTKFDDKYVRRLHYQKSERFTGWNHPRYCDDKAENDTNREVIAWQPLPQPFQKGE